MLLTELELSDLRKWAEVWGESPGMPQARLVLRLLDEYEAAGVADRVVADERNKFAAEAAMMAVTIKAARSALAATGLFKPGEVDDAIAARIADLYDRLHRD